MSRLLILAALLASVSAAAHIEMEVPTPRFNDGANKWCPCGTGGDGSRSNDGCELGGSDPNRGTTSNTYQAGETIRVRWRETIGHSGRFRISFDPDGADQADFDQHILADIADPGGSLGNAGEANVWVADVTLPDVSCDNCTLQLIQVMNGNTVTPVTDLTGFASYFQCANLVIEGGAPVETGEGEGEGEGEDDPGTGCSSATVTSAGAPFSLASLGVLLLFMTRRRRRRAR